MDLKDKELLLKDLCARLPYGVEVYYSETVPILTLKTINSEKGTCIAYDHSQWYRHSKFHIEVIKPYLRPMSSMTEEEKKELEKLIDEKLNGNIDQENDEQTPWVLYDTTGIKNFIGGERFYFDEMSFIYDYLNAHHFDYRGLIEKDLALKALEGMYN